MRHSKIESYARDLEARDSSAEGAIDVVVLLWIIMWRVSLLTTLYFYAKTIH